MAMKEGLGENMFSANTTAEADALAADNDMSMVDSEGQRSEGTFSADGKTVIIDLEQAKKVGAFNVAGHELLHRVLFNTLYKEVDGKLVGSDVARSLGLELDKQLDKINPSILKNAYLKSRLELYKNEGKSMLAEEKLTILSDALRLGAITIDETGIDKFNSYFRRLFQNLGWKKIKFKDGKSVVNFIQDYNKSLDKGALGKSIKQGAEEGFEVVRGKDGIKKLKDDFEVIVKRSRSEVTPKAKEFINLNKEGVITNEGLVEIINSPSSKSEDKFGAIEAVVEGNWPVISNAIKFNPTGNIPMDAVKTAVTEQIQGIFPGRNVPLFKGYNPDQGKVNTVIGTFLGPRQAEILERAKKIGGITQEGTSIDSKEAKQAVDTSSEIDLDKKKEKPVKPKESLRESIPISDAVVQKVRDAVVKTFGTRLPSVESKDFKEELRKAFRTELKTTIAKDVLGTRDSYETFLRDNFEAIYEAIPQEVINKRFKAFKEPVLKKDGKQLRENTAQGNAVFYKEKNI